MPRYETSFDIDAPPDRVWQVLTDFDEYGEWNPQIPRARGTAARGSTLSMRLQLTGRPPMDLRAILEDVDTGKLLTWRGHLAAPWFFEGYRRFTLEPLERDRTRVTHLEDVHGAFAPIFGLLVGGAVAKSQRDLNDALRRRAEASRRS